MTNNESYFSIGRSRYHAPGKHILCIGSRTKADIYKEDGTPILGWNETPDPALFDKILELRLLPTQAQQAKPKIPPFVKDLKHLFFLEIPVSFLPELTEDDLPAGLQTLMISNDKEHTKLVTQQKLQWPGLRLPNLKGLVFFNAFNSVELTSLLQITPFHVPDLEYLQVRIDKKGKILNELATFTTLQHLEVEFAGNHDLMTAIKSPLKALSIISAGKLFPINDIAHLKDLQSIWLNSIQAAVDCEVLANLPAILEINIINTSTILNPEALLQCPTLKSLFVLNCRQPFKKIKADFDALGLERLDINYA